MWEIVALFFRVAKHLTHSTRTHHTYPLLPPPFVSTLVSLTPTFDRSQETFSSFPHRAASMVVSPSLEETYCTVAEPKWARRGGSGLGCWAGLAVRGVRGVRVVCGWVHVMRDWVVGLVYRG